MYNKPHSMAQNKLFDVLKWKPTWKYNIDICISNNVCINVMWLGDVEYPAHQKGV